MIGVKNYGEFFLFSPCFVSMDMVAILDFIVLANGVFECARVKR